jgi:hypothetical protein
MVVEPPWHSEGCCAIAVKGQHSGTVTDAEQFVPGTLAVRVTEPVQGPVTVTLTGFEPGPTVTLAGVIVPWLEERITVPLLVEIIFIAIVY